MIVIGLTGSIGTGKTTVTGQFAALGAATLDSDAVVHALLGGEAVKDVAALFPETLEKNRINRRLLGAEVFGNPAKLKALEAILHPRVRAEQDRFIRKARLKGEHFVVLDIPLLFETQGEKRCDVTVVTTAPRFIQQQRVYARPNMTPEKFKRILAAQMPDCEKRQRADFVVHTGQGKAASFKEVRRILAKLSSRAGGNPARTPSDAI
jgi:dephospho-CoA kinase